jgi:hypothetical protein
MAELTLAREKDGLWKYSFSPDGGGTVKGQVKVSPGKKSEERVDVLAKIRAGAHELIKALDAMGPDA